MTAGTEVREPITRFTRPFNTTGQPVVALPAPVRGLPVGIQVVGRTNTGALGAAAWLEQEWQQLARMKSKELFPPVFSRHALAYQRRLEEIMSRGESRGRMRALELVDAGPGMRILDLACGPGTLSRDCSRLGLSPGGDVVGVDLAAGMIELARANAPSNARFEVMDMEQLAFDDASFDAAVCGHGLQFVSDLSRALSEARRVLRPGALWPRACHRWASRRRSGRSSTR